MGYSIIKFVTVFLCFLFFSCTKNTSEPSFYYWKTKIDISGTEKEILNDLQVKKLYVRFFDVDISKETHSPAPVGVINNLDSLPKNLQVIPVVFITNRTFIGLLKDEVSELAKHVFSKINYIKNNYNEIQFDCDWSGKTKENYFLFLNEIKKLAGGKIKLSATIRLHQVKYAYKTGIPPVDRGVLMFYNMGDVTSTEETNSIYNKTTAKKYTDFISGYKLPLDAALPIFKWLVHYRNNKLIGLINSEEQIAFKDTLLCLPIKNNTTFKVIKDHLQDGVFYKTNDELRLESVTEDQLAEVAQILKQNLKQENRKIIFYYLDEKNINFYGKKTFTTIMSDFN